MEYAQANRPWRVHTALPIDTLLLHGFSGREAISELYRFQLELAAPLGKDVSFDQVVGKPITVEHEPANGPRRYFHGIVRSLKQMHRDSSFTYYQAEVVPSFWRLTQNVQSRIFQQASLKDILETVLTGLNVSFQLRSNYPRHNFCVQYQESDYNFAARLMEEEGAYFYFLHDAKSETLVIADTSLQSSPIDSRQLRFAGSLGQTADEQWIKRWHKTQQVTAGKFSLVDHSFQLSGQKLQADMPLLDAVVVGQVKHSLAVGDNSMLDSFVYPATVAHKHDGISPTGADQDSELSDVFDDNQRLVRLRMEEAAARSVVIEGGSDASQLVPGLSFALVDHFDGDGHYLVTHVEHRVRTPFFRSSDQKEIDYSNDFGAIPLSLAYRPRRCTPIPTVKGSQTATVVGPAGEEIFTDKYGRVKVQFHWDRLGQSNAGSSCWLRVAHGWAGKNWGHIHIPRIGQEVIVDFLEGDPDWPIITGSVYNSAQMPPFPLPQHKTQSGIKSQTYRGDAGNFHGIGFEDQKGQEHIHIHSERHSTQSAEQNHYLNVGSEHHVNIGKLHTRQVGGLPKTNHTFTTGGGASGGGPIESPAGSPLSSGSAPDLPPPRPDAIGTVPKASAAPILGSGSGAGNTGQTASGSFQQSGPYLWNPPIAGTWAQDLDLVIGWRRCNTLGLYTQTNIGQMTNSTIGLGAFGAVAGTVPTTGLVSGLSACAGFGGVTNVIFGGNTLLHYGPTITVDRGPKATVTSATSSVASTAAKVAATMYGLSAMIDVFLPAICPVSSKTTVSSGSNDVPVGGIISGVIAAVANEAILAIWSKIEMLTTGTEIITKAGKYLETVTTNTTPAVLNEAGDVVKKQVTTTTYSFNLAPGGPMDAPAVSTNLTESLHSLYATEILLYADATGTLDSGAVMIQAMGAEEIDGVVGIMGTQEVNLAAGDLASVCIESVEEATGLVTIDCGADGTILLESGEEMEPNFVSLDPEGITVSSAELITLVTDENMIVVNPEEGVNVVVGGNTIDVTEEGIVLECGASSITLLEDSIVLEAGGATIELSSEGIVINGVTLTLAGDGDVSIASGDLSIDAAAVEIDAAAVSLL